MSHDRSRDPFLPAAPEAAPAAQMPLPPLEVPTARQRGAMGMLVNVLLGVALVVAVGGVAFAVGRVTVPPTAAPRTGGFVGGPTASGAPGGFTGGPGGAAGGVSLQGVVTAVTADSITVELPSGQSLTIPTDAQTTWYQREGATATDVTAGSTVIVQLQAGRGAFNGNGNGGQGGGPTASGAPGRTVGPASTVTLVPAGS